MARLNETRTAAVLTEAFGGVVLQAVREDTHAAHGTTLLVGIDAEVAIGAVRGRALIVPPGAIHRAAAPGPVASFTFDPELCPRIAGLARDGGIRRLDGALGDRVTGALASARASLADPDVIIGIGAELVGELAVGRAAAVDRRVVRAVEGLRDPAGEGGDVVARSRLSPAHLRALFVRDVGIPMRTYALWRRLLHALARVGPLDLTAAAHAAGFADLAHFSRTCRRMLGYSPSLLRSSLATASP